MLTPESGTSGSAGDPSRRRRTILITSLVLWAAATAGYIIFRAGPLIWGVGHAPTSAMALDATVDPATARKNVAAVMKRFAAAEKGSTERLQFFLDLLQKAEDIPGPIPADVRTIVSGEMANPDNEALLTNIVLYLLRVDDHSIVPELFDLYPKVISEEKRRQVALCAIQIDPDYVNGRLAENKSDLNLQFAKDIEEFLRKTQRKK